MLRKVLIGVATAALAALSFNAAIGQVTAWKQPALAMAMPLPNGFAQASAAQLLLARAQPQTPGRQMDLQLDLDPATAEEVSALSRAAYRSEPLNSNAIRNLAFVADWKGQSRRARQLMLDAIDLTRRDGAATFWLMLAYGKQGRIEPMLRQFDHGLRTNRNAQDRLMPAIVQSMANEAMVAPMARLLRADPPWKSQFWNGVFRVPTSLVNAAKLRLVLAFEGYRNERQNDQYLLDALVAQRHFEETYTLARKLTEPKGESFAPLYNGSFDRLPGFAPYDWQTFFESALTADVLRDRRLLRIETYADGSGRSARQLVRLPDQVYRLHVRASEWDTLDPGAIYFRITCADAPTAERNEARLDLTSPDWTVTFRKTRSDCVYHWFEIYARAQPQQRDNTILIDEINLSAATAGA